jgi:hypothetical protein
MAIHYEVQQYIDDLEGTGVLPIRARFDVDQENSGNRSRYILRGANGERRVISSWAANNAWANTGWPTVGKYALLWPLAERLSK